MAKYKALRGSVVKGLNKLRWCTSLAPSLSHCSTLSWFSEQDIWHTLDTVSYS